MCFVYGELVAEKLEALDEVDRVVVMNDIDNLLFRATMKRISKQSQQQYPTNNLLQQSYSNNNASLSTAQPPFSTFIQQQPQFILWSHKLPFHDQTLNFHMYTVLQNLINPHLHLQILLTPQIFHDHLPLSSNYYAPPEHLAEANALATTPQQKLTSL